MIKSSLAALALFSSLAFAQLPDAPSTTKPPVEAAPFATRVPKQKIAKPDRFFNRKFTISTIAFAGSLIFDGEMTAHGVKAGKCAEAYGDPNPSRAQIYGRMGAIDAVLLGFAALMRKGKLPIAPYATLAFGTGRHIYTGSQWKTMGCF